MSPLIASSTRRKNREGASHPSCDESSSIPSVGSCDWRNGNATTSTMAAPKAAWVTAARRRSPGGRRQATQTTRSTSGRNAVAFTSAPHVTTAIAQWVRPASTHQAATAIARATKRSLWPLPADWKRMTGLSPNAATAKAARPGRTRRHTAAITNVVARLAPIAISRKVSTSTSSRDEVRVTAPAMCVKSGP